MYCGNTIVEIGETKNLYCGNGVAKIEEEKVWVQAPANGSFGSTLLVLGEYILVDGLG